MDPAHKALARKALIGVGGVTLVGVLGVGLYNAVFDRPPKFARVVAEDLPADSVGMVAFANPAHNLELLDGAIAKDARADLEQQLGFDPFAASSYATLGFDVEAPIGFALVDLQREVFVITLGLADADEARKTIETYAEKAGVSGWEDREFEGVEGMWLAEPPVAVLFRDDRLLVVATETPRHQSAVEQVATELASLRAGDSLASSTGFRSIHRFPGEPIMLGFINATELANNPMAMATFGSSEVESMAVALTSDNRDIHLISQTIVAKDSPYLKYMSGRSRSTKALDRVPGPVYAGLHWSVDPEYVRTLLDELGRFGKDALDEAEREAERELGVSVERDLLGAWTGELGILWTGAGEDRWGGIAFVGVHDETAAEATLERMWSQTGGDERRSTDAGELHLWDERPSAQAKIWSGYAWFGIGESRLDEVDRDAKGFRKTTKVDAIADLIGGGSIGVAFVDLVELRQLLRSLPDGEQLDRYADVIDELEALTMHSTIDGQTFTWTMTLHTTVDDAYDTLIERLIADIAKDQGDSMFDELSPLVAE